MPHLLHFSYIANLWGFMGREKNKSQHFLLDLGNINKGWHGIYWINKGPPVHSAENFTHILSFYLHKQNYGVGTMITHSPSLILQRHSQSPNVDLESSTLLTVSPFYELWSRIYVSLLNFLLHSLVLKSFSFISCFKYSWTETESETYVPYFFS